MNIEFQPSMEYENPIIVSADVDSASETEYGPIGIAKMGSSPGGFRYEWLIEYMSKEEAKELLKALRLAVQAVEEAEKEASLDEAEQEVVFPDPDGVYRSVGEDNE